MLEEQNISAPAEKELADDLEKNKEMASDDKSDQQQSQEDTPFSENKKPSPVVKVVLTICIIVILAAAAVVGVAYHQWNQRYQASQPEYKSVQAFSLLFKDPDWALLYTMAGIEDTPFENRDTFVQYMNRTFGGKHLSYMQLPAQDPLVRKYAVYYDGGTIGAFTMVGTEGSIPEWNLGTVELYFTRSHSVTIEKAPETTVYVNGIPLDSSYTIRTTSTVAEEFLPDGIHGYRMELQQVDGLLMEPTVTAVDAGGNPIAMVYDSSTHTYAPMIEKGPEIADSHMQFALEAAKANAAFAVRANSFTDLRKYFDPNSNAYAAVCAAAPLLDGCAQYKFDPNFTQVTNYRSYGSSLFSATVSLKLDVTMENGDAHSFDLSWHYLYRQNYTGNFMIIEISDESFHSLREQVRLTFIHDGKTLDSKMLDIHQSSFQCPEISAPQGMVFSGWARKIKDAENSEAMGILFVPDASGTVSLPSGTTLESMTLFAIFHKAV